MYQPILRTLSNAYSKTEPHTKARDPRALFCLTLMPCGNELLAVDDVKMKRLTIDVTEELHRRIKANCAGRGVKMADEIRTLLEQHFD